MSGEIDPSELENINLESELAVKRLRKLVEFLRVVCQREVQILEEPENIPESVDQKSEERD